MSRNNKRTPPFDPTRRRILASLAASGAGAATGVVHGDDLLVPNSSDAVTMPVPAGLPAPKDSKIDHIVVVMMENRSFDHYFGWLPSADGVQAGRTFLDVNGVAHSSFDLAPNFQNCTSADPKHSYTAGRTEFNHGKMDGFLLTAPAGDTFPIGYYTRDSLPFFGPASDQWTVCDRYFSGILASTTPNRIYMHAGQTDRISNTTTISTLPTIWDRLKDKGRRGEYYYGDVPFLALWGTKYRDIASLYSNFKARAAAGNLADVTFIDPRFIGEAQGLSNDDHPLADIRNGQVLLADIYNTLRTSPKWSRTLLIINYDEWGGFADHVPPPLAPVSDVERTVVHNNGRLGMRVPCMIIGPRAIHGVVHDAFDPNSILNLVTWRFGLEPLGVRAATSLNMAVALDFRHRRANPAPIVVPPGPYGSNCDFAATAPSGSTTSDMAAASRSHAEHMQEWQRLKELARRNGFEVGA